jgi:hypothetical protein
MIHFQNKSHKKGEAEWKDQWNVTYNAYSKITQYKTVQRTSARTKLISIFVIEPVYHNIHKWVEQAGLSPSPLLLSWRFRWYVNLRCDYFRRVCRCQGCGPQLGHCRAVSLIYRSLVLKPHIVINRVEKVHIYIYMYI